MKIGLPFDWSSACNDSPAKCAAQAMKRRADSANLYHCGPKLGVLLEGSNNP